MVIGCLDYSGQPEAPLISTVDILLDSDMYFDILIERLPEPLSRFGLM